MSDDEIEVELYHQASDRTTSILIDLKPLKLKSIITGESDGNVITLHIGKIEFDLCNEFLLTYIQLFLYFKGAVWIFL